MNFRSHWRFKDNIPFQTIEKILQKKFSLRSIELTDKSLTLLDDFNWQIWQSGLLLTREEGCKLELWRDDDHCLATCSAHEESCFWWQLPKGRLAEKLEGLISKRAFVAKYSCHLTTVQLAILNEDEKIVVRLQLYTLSTGAQQAACLATVSPLRGYEKEYTQVIECLSILDPQEVATLNLRNLLLQSGLKVDIPESKPIFNLQVTEPVEAAVSRIAVSLIQLARGQEPGIIADVDTEFVHQYRVNIRKTRSLISLFKKSFSPPRYQRFKAELKAFGSQTNDLRDLDVFLLDQNYYLIMLPEALCPGLNQIFKRLKRRRTLALKRVINSLSSTAYQEQISHLLQTLQQTPELGTKQSRLEIKPFTGKKILAQYQLIYAEGLAIDPDTPDAAVHELRIECKKLRYLLELFIELFPDNEVKPLIKILKILQDNLGRFNDFSVQREFLAHFGQGKNISAAQLASINGLTAVLYNKQLHERSLVAENIAVFLDKPISDQFQRLFY